ncbi:bleomycin hydrolase [Arthroderma uncinatum]|uniref:bleomycin hydrolase n=1 Tax=Arthroderma uncinatum TaxID=74035 RepID=UPI00144A6EDD|nr:bleomycin hydrolase [Arthroderma uncinatum]KAF3482619.1 bleomycin hydrolase [Arthroderma uncinatum]
MGSNQSKLQEAPGSSEKNTAAVSMSGILQLSDDEYVHVETGAPPPYSSTRERSVGLSAQQARTWEKELLADPKNRLAMSALSANPVSSILSSRSAAITDTQTFNIRIPFEGTPITNQASSGRCWIFAATNVFRVALMKKYNLEQFELSQSYLFYWDKLEKANWFMEQVIDTASQSLDSRLVQRLLERPVEDGGQWDMAANLVRKYGLVPQALYPDSFSATHSSELGSILTTKLREHALIIRRMARSKDPAVFASIADTKDGFLKEIHSILTIMLGPPPSAAERFVWEYHDAKGKFNKTSMTPVQFAAGLSSRDAVRANQGTDVNELFSLVNDPRNSYERLLTVDRLGNVIGGRPITYVNVCMDDLKRAAVAMLHAGHPVFFSCDVGKFSDRKRGIMDTALYDYSLSFNIQFGMSKAGRLKTGETAMTHAMVLTGVHVENGKPVRWRVQNSWGPDVGDHGWFVMTDQWMDEFLFQVVVDQRYVAQNIRDVLTQKPIVLPRWDPMGTLA